MQQKNKQAQNPFHRQGTLLEKFDIKYATRDILNQNIDSSLDLIIQKNPQKIGVFEAGETVGSKDSI